MSPAIARLLSHCEQVLQGDASLIALLREQGFVCQEQCWDFQLPALHAWLGHHADQATTYPEFLQQLYASDLNERLATLGAQVVIAENRGKVSESLYRLQRLP